MRARIMSLLLVCLLAVPMVGCSWGETDLWPVITPALRTITTQGATLVFSNETVAAKKAEICAAVAKISTVLANYEDPNATAATLRDLIVDSIASLDLDPQVKTIVTKVVDGIATTAVNFLRDNYSDLIAKDEAKAVLEVSKAVALGLDDACSKDQLLRGALQAPTNSFLQRGSF